LGWILVAEILLGGTGRSTLLLLVVYESAVSGQGEEDSNPVQTAMEHETEPATYQMLGYGSMS